MFFNDSSNGGGISSTDANPPSLWSLHFVTISSRCCFDGVSAHCTLHISYQDRLHFNMNTCVSVSWHCLHDYFCSAHIFSHARTLHTAYKFNKWRQFAVLSYFLWLFINFSMPRLFSAVLLFLLFTAVVAVPANAAFDWFSWI